MGPVAGYPAPDAQGGNGMADVGLGRGTEDSGPHAGLAHKAREEGLRVGEVM